MRKVGRTLEARTRALRLRLLADMTSITADSTDSEIERMERRWRYVRRRLAHEATEPGESARLIQEMVATPELQTFFVARSAYRARHPEIKRTINQRYYERVLKDERTTPEARAQLSEARRRQRAAKAAQDGDREDSDARDRNLQQSTCARTSGTR